MFAKLRGPRPSRRTTEGVDFFAQSPTVASRYDNFGHQVLGIYLGPTASGYSFYFAVHNTLSDENPDKFLTLSLSLTGTAKHPQEVKIVYTQLAQGNWSIKLESVGQSSLVFTSQEYGAAWNTTTGLDGVRYFTSQGGTKPGGPLEWTTMSVRSAYAIAMVRRAGFIKPARLFL